MAKSTTSVRYKAEERRRHAVIIAIVLLLVGLVMIVAGTYAYYRSTITGQFSGTIAVWTFRANNSTSSFNITLTPSQTSSTLNSTIAPGTSGSFSIVLNTVGSGLAADYVITFSNFQNKPTNLKFYSDSAHNNQVDITASNYSISGTLAANATETKTIYWSWPRGDSSSIAADNSSAGKNTSFTINVAAQQHQ